MKPIGALCIALVTLGCGRSRYVPADALVAFPNDAVADAVSADDAFTNDALVDAQSPFDATTDAGHCPAMYTRIGGLPHLYRVVSSTVSWNVAADVCASDGARLALPTISAEATLLAAQIPAGGSWAWLGMTDRALEGTWTRQDGTPVMFFNWAPGQPSSSGVGEDCASILPLGTFNDSPCDTPDAVNIRHFICECVP